MDRVIINPVSSLTIYYPSVQQGLWIARSRFSSGWRSEMKKGLYLVLVFHGLCGSPVEGARG